MGNNPPKSSPATTETGHFKRHFATGPRRRNVDIDSRHRSPREGYALTGISMGGHRIRAKRRLASEVFVPDRSNSRETLVNFETGRNVHTEPVNGPSTLTAEQEERCYDPNDTTFTFVDGKDDMDFEYNDYKSLRAKMSCGHTVTPTSLINWCRMLLDEGSVEFVCGLPDCNAVWPCDEVYKMALLTPEEIKDIENTLFNRAKDNFGAKKCPVLTAEQEERCYDPNDTTFTFVDGEDDMDFELNEYKSLRAKMSCGHTVTPTSLINWCRWLLDQGEVEFVCGQPDCNAVWPCDEVYKMALLTPEEIKDIEKTLFNRAKDNFGAKKCPGCMSLMLRKDQNDLRVHCTLCTRNKGKNYDFCWQCLKEWTRPSLHADHCADPECINQSLETLRKCPEITFKDVKNVTGCPSVRACPTCGLLIEHSTNNCKNIICSRCKVKFCFVCLKLFKDCVNPYIACTSGVAPRQTSIPVWEGK